MKTVYFKKVWYWLGAASTVLSVVALAVYIATGRTQFDPNYSNRVFIGLGVAAALGLFSLVKPFRYVLFGQFVFGLFGAVNYITSQLNLLGNIFYNVDGSTIPVSLVVGIAASLVSMILGLVSAILMKPATEAAA